MTGRRPYRGLSAQERISERRGRLLKAALELFGTRGYATTTIEDLCASAKVSTRGFYECFDSRDDLLIAARDEILRESVQATKAAVEDVQASDVVERTRAGLRAYVQYITEDLRRARLLHVEILAVGQPYGKLRLDSNREFIKMITANYATELSTTRAGSGGDTDAETGAGSGSGSGSGSESGSEDTIDIRYLAIGLVGAVRDLLADWFYSNDRKPPEQVVATAEFLITAALDRSLAKARGQGGETDERGEQGESPE